MTANASAHVVIVKVGADEQDWSKQFNGFDIGHPKRDRSGTLTYSGTLELIGDWQAPESINPRVNQARWFRGQVIKLQVSNSSGAFVTPWYGLLKVTKEPQAPPLKLSTEPQVLSLEVSCELTLRDFASPDPDNSNQSTGTLQTRTQLIGTHLASAGVTATWVGTVDEYPIAYPALNEGGSYVALAGEIAYAGFRALRQTKNGTIDAVDFRPNPYAEPFAIITIGHDEIEYSAIEGPETPVEELHGTGTTAEVVDTWEEKSECFFVYAPGSNEATQIVCTLDRADEDEELHQVTCYEQLGLIMPNQYRGVKTFAFSSENKQAYRYEAKDAGKLLEIDKQITRFFGVTLAEFYNAQPTADKAKYGLFTTVQDTRGILYHSYDATEVLREKLYLENRPLGAILPDLNETTASPIFPSPSASSIEKWDELSPDTWRYVSADAAPRISVNPDTIPDNPTIQDQVGLISSNPKVETSNSGQVTPPNCERKKPRYAKKDKQLDGAAYFGTYAGSNNQERKRSFEVPWMISDEQASAIAQFEGSTIIGRRQGSQLLIPLTDAWLNPPSPCPVIHVREPRVVAIANEAVITYDTIVYQVDALSVAHSAVQGAAGMELIWLATIPAGATVPTLPYIPIIKSYGGVKVGGYSYTDAPTLPAVLTFSYGGVKVGGYSYTGSDIGGAISWEEMTIADWNGMTFDDWNSLEA